MITIKEYIDACEINHFARWFNKLKAVDAAKIITYLTRIEQGNFSNVKSVSKGVFECKIDFGPGYRVYFGKDGDELIILLGGGTKKRQQKDITEAQFLWEQYKNRKKGMMENGFN